MHKRLCDPDVAEKEKLRILLGLHIKFWHVGKAEMHRMLLRGGHGKNILDLIPKALAACKECSNLKPPLTMPL
eukprot:4583211-Lingulodinium_polyedra.AAC.1